MDNQTLYQKLNVSNFKEIQQEAIAYLKSHPEIIKDDLNTDDFFHVSLDDFPILKSFLDPRIKTRIQETSFCLVPAKFETAKHIDGLKKDDDRKLYNQVRDVVLNHPEFESLGIDVSNLPIANQFVMIIPLINYEDTNSYWYNNNDVADSDERIDLYTRKEYPYSFFVSFVKPEVSINPIGSTKVDCITFIRSNIFHNVSNQGSDTRVVFVIRFTEHRHYESLEDVFKHQDLL
jgi:hypothetical protein